MSDQMQAVRGKVREILRKNGVKRAAFFGSIVRDEMTEESDIDILIEFEGRRSHKEPFGPRPSEERAGGCYEQARRYVDLQVAPS